MSKKSSKSKKSGRSQKQAFGADVVIPEPDPADEYGKDSKNPDALPNEDKSGP